MATTQRIPGHPRRRETRQVKKQTSKTHEVTFFVFLVASATLCFSGCKSGSHSGSLAARSAHFNNSSFAIRNEGETSQQIGSVKNDPPSSKSSKFGLVSYQSENRDAALPPKRSSELEFDHSNAVRIPASDNEFRVSNNATAAFQSDSISLEQVLESVQRCYPEIEIAIGELESAEGKILSSWGQFDSVFAAHSISQPLGFYQTYRNSAGVTQPLFGGGEVYGAYRIGDGNFEPWFGERETNEGGELKAGFSLPFLKDRDIDARRAAIRSAEADLDQVRSDIESRLLQFQRFATQAYWDWVASGRAVQVQQRLLELAQTRVDQINLRVERGDLALLAKIDNDRFIAKRKNDLIKARRAQEKSAIKLSLFLRDAECNPSIALVDQLPTTFPLSARIPGEQTELDITSAISVRPELIALAAERRKSCVDLDYANNLTLPKLDMKGFAGQDIGGAASSKGDKTPFELQVGLYAEVPLQRREARGKIQSAEGKISQIDAKSRFITDKIRAEIQDAASAVNAAHDQIEQSESNVELTRRSLELGRKSFDAGDVDLISLNIYETAVADAELQLLDAQFKFFYYLAVYETAISGRAFN